jgi:hypothetical protein
VLFNMKTIKMRLAICMILTRHVQADGWIGRRQIRRVQEKAESYAK